MPARAKRRRTENETLSDDEMLSDHEMLPECSESDGSTSSGDTEDSFSESDESERVSSYDEEESDSDSDETCWKKCQMPQWRLLEDLNFDSENLKSTHAFTAESTPLEYFERFFDDEIISFIAAETNQYATQSKLNNWEYTSSVEIKAFLGTLAIKIFCLYCNAGSVCLSVGLLIIMSLHELPAVKLFWASDPLFHVSSVANVMTLNRFKKLMEAFHLNDNSKAPSRNSTGRDKLFKVRPLIVLLNERFTNECGPTESYSIDECMIPFKGRSSLKQYMPMKPTKRGFKVWARTHSTKGYLYQFEIYAGKRDLSQVQEQLGKAVVKRLTQSLHGSMCHVTFDNFFTSYDLMEELFAVDIFSTGTVRPNRKGLSELTKSKAKMKKYEYKWRVRENT